MPETVVQVQLKLKLRPAQERQLERWLWRLTGAYNWAVKKVGADAQAGLFYGSYDLKALVNGHGKKIGVPQQTLRDTIEVAGNAWRRHWKGLGRRPQLKGRRNRLNSLPFGTARLGLDGTSVAVPCLGRVRCHHQRVPAGHIGSGRIVRRASGWYACLFVQAEPVVIPHVADGAVGIDPGFSSLLTLSTGEVIDHPHELRAGAERLAQAQRGHRRRLTARLQERIANQRKDRNHKLSRRLVSENATIAWSKDPTSSVQRLFGKSVASAAHSQLRSMLAYKCRSGGRRYIEVNSRNSTRICSACGAKSGPSGYAGLKVRHWVCACGARHDRDCNAAVNTLKAGLGISLERTGDGSSRNRRVSKTAMFMEASR